MKRTKALSQADLLKMEEAHASSVEALEAEEGIEKTTVADTGNDTPAPAEEAK